MPLVLEDKGDVTGIDGYEENLNELLRVPFDYCVPTVNVDTEMMDCIDVKGNPNHILIMYVMQSNQLHVNQADEVYYRIGDKSIMSQIRAYTKKAGYKPSFCYYKQWGTKKKTGQGHKPVRQLRFSKSSNPEIEKAYATHYVDGKRTAEIKAEQAFHVGNEESNLDFRQRKM